MSRLSLMSAEDTVLAIVRKTEEPRRSTESLPDGTHCLPENVDLSSGDDQVHQRLKNFGFVTPCGHLDQAIDAHTRGDWAAANAQIRTFIESLILAIAARIASAYLPPNPGLNNGFQALAKCGFLSEGRSEWNQDGEGMLNGLMKMLNSDGSHKGLSDEDHSTMRLHIALVTARAILNRFANNG